MKQSPGPSVTIEQRFYVLSILAVVYKHAKTDEILVILLPYGGRSVESLAGGYRYGMGFLSEELPPRP